MMLQLKDVAFTYSRGTSFEHEALGGVSIALAPGDITLVIGPTGSGKSTLLRVIAGLLRPIDGSIEVDGAPVDAPLLQKGARLGLVFQNPESQLFAETVIQDVAFGPMNMGHSRKEAHLLARSALELVGLPPDHFGPRSPFTMSGGEARRVALAGILAMKPRFLLLDEPTAALDASGRARVRQILREISSECGLLVATHDVEEFLGIASQVLILNQGSVVFYGSPEVLVRDPGPFFEAGTQPPEILRTQLLARANGIDVGEFSLNPADVAVRLLAARSASRGGVTA